ncbi:MAG: polymer-forming cytoskeletal protein [Prolixibacteraceae bacterium]|nr:polymer-forming cytoskeletal protein [Prolixibacteraceae bacterium]
MNQKPNFEPTGQSINLISKGTQITGDIVAESDIRIDGYLKGNIKSKGKLVVGTTGQIEGEIECNTVEVSGNVNGKIITHDLLTLKSTANVTGDIQATKLSIEPGSIFTGSCTMGRPAADRTNIPKK